MKLAIQQRLTSCQLVNVSQKDEFNLSCAPVQSHSKIKANVTAKEDCSMPMCIF